MNKGWHWLVLWAVIALSVGVFSTTWVLKHYEKEMMFISNNYEQVSLPGMDYSKWQKVKENK